MNDKKKIVKAIEEGRVKFAFPNAFPIDTVEPDFTVTEVELRSSWGKWKEGNTGNQGGFVLAWASKSAGFGELTFYKDFDGKLHCQNEYMSKEFIKTVLDKFAEQLILDDIK